MNDDFLANALKRNLRKYHMKKIIKQIV